MRNPTPVILEMRTEMWKRKWSAYRLAKESGVTEHTVHRLMKGHGSTVETLESVAKALGLQITAIRRPGSRSN